MVATRGEKMLAKTPLGKLLKRVIAAEGKLARIEAKNSTVEAETEKIKAETEKIKAELNAIA